MTLLQKEKEEIVEGGGEEEGECPDEKNQSKRHTKRFDVGRSGFNSTVLKSELHLCTFHCL